MKKRESQAFEVTVSHSTSPMYGDHYEEQWKVKETGKQFRPNDLPSLGIYDARTKAPLYLEWTLEETGDLGREGHKPSIISLHPDDAYMAWYEQREFSDGEMGRQEVYRAFPKKAAVDPNTGGLRHLYKGAVRGTLGRGTPFYLTTPIYDTDLTNHPQELSFPK